MRVWNSLAVVGRRVHLLGYDELSRAILDEVELEKCHDAGTIMVKGGVILGYSFASKEQHLLSQHSLMMYRNGNCLKFVGQPIELESVSVRQVSYILVINTRARKHGIALALSFCVSDSSDLVQCRHQVHPEVAKDTNRA